MKTISYLWQDRKRICGLPITFTKYSLTEDRLFRETGLLSLKEEEVLLYRVRDLELRRSLGQRIYGVGTVCVHSSDKTTPHLDLVNVKHPREVKETIFQAVEQVKNQRRMRTTELVDDGEDELYDDEHDEME